MRKLLLGTTAVAAAALFAPGAMSQSLSSDAFSSSLTSPAASLRGLEVRLGGYFRAMYNYTDQDGANNSTTRLGKSDFSQEIEIHVLASGKAANGLRYGVALEIENDAYRQPQAGSPATNVVTAGAKNTLNYDEAWAYLAGPWGQVRFGDEDGAVVQLASGHVNGFGLGGLDSGATYQQVVGSSLRPTLNTINDIGDNTKLIYLSPQMYGFDAGISFAFNSQEGALSGCDSLATASLCDRVSAVAGGSMRRRNEVQTALRWRGSFGAVGVAATVGYIGADSVKNIGGISADRMDLAWAGIQATTKGFTLGGWYTGGYGNGGFATMMPARAHTAVVDDRRMDSYLVGVTYTIDAVTVGAHAAQTWSAGSQTAAAGRRDTGFSVGGNYRLAPGLDLFAEYNRVQRKEMGVNFLGAGVTASDKVDTAIALAGFRVAF